MCFISGLCKYLATKMFLLYAHDVVLTYAEVRRKDCNCRHLDIMVCGRISGLKNGRATSEWLESTYIWAAMTMKSQQHKPLIRLSCCAMCPAAMVTTALLWSPTFRQSTIRSVTKACCGFPASPSLWVFSLQAPFGISFCRYNFVLACREAYSATTICM